MITTKQFEEAAQLLGVEVAVIKAVTEVESSGSGFLSDGQPVILFEPHILWRELKKREINPYNFLPEYSDVLYEKWGTKPYGKPSQQHARLQRATQIHREAALASCSWGLFQILGNNYKACGCASVQDFINEIYKGEYEHLKLFIAFVKNNGLADELQRKDWEGFAKRYNGPSYAKNNYHKKLNAAYLKHKK